MKTRTIGDSLVIYIRGRLDMAFLPTIEEEIMGLIETAKFSSLILNLKDLEYISTSGLKLLVVIVRKLTPEKRQLKLCNFQSGVDRVFESAQVKSIFDIYTDEKDALNS